MVKVLSVNSGSSSIKFKLFDMPAEQVLASGMIERIGLKKSVTTIKWDGQKFKDIRDIKDHEDAIGLMLVFLKKLEIIKDFSEIQGVGHRVVAGGEYIKAPMLVNDEVAEKVRELSKLAPLHNPAAALGIRLFRKLLPNAISVVVADTAFHQGMPAKNYLYSVPYEWYEKYSIRRYGAHGTSHEYVAKEAAKMMQKPLADLKLITCHLGAGASITAIKDGKSFDTSMGFTPLAGLTMAKRSGDVDPSALQYVMNNSDIKDINEMIDILNNKSGLLGISGVSEDMRDVEKAAEEGNKRAQLAFDICEKNVIKYIGQYIAELQGVDGIVFTAGIGENSWSFRSKVMKDLAYLGIKEDRDNNDTFGKNVFISTPDSKVKVMRIMTNEELVIARDTYDFMEKNPAEKASANVTKEQISR